MKLDKKSTIDCHEIFNSLCIYFRLISPFLYASRLEGSCMHSCPWLIASSGRELFRLFHGCNHSFNIDLSFYLLFFIFYFLFFKLSARLSRLVILALLECKFNLVLWLPKLEHTVGWLQRSVSLYMYSILFKHFAWFQIEQRIISF